MEGYNTQEAIKAQQKFTEDNKAPHFAPGNGVCWSCNKNIYAPITRPSGHVTGKTVEQAGKGLITGCPHCNRSYCD